MSSYFYDPAQGHGLAHDPLTALIAPRPIGWISTISRDGIRNLAPYSFANAICGHPPILAFSSSGYKDSVRNAEETGEFVWNVACAELGEAMSVTSLAADPIADEFDLAGLTPAPGVAVAAPHVLEAPAALECRTLGVHRLVDLDRRETATFLVMGQVVGVHIHHDFLQDGRFSTAKAAPLGRCGYLDEYVAAEDFRYIARP